ncbi:hypothetical protein DOY81_014668, partial [Sarcophaga bullata]
GQAYAYEYGEKYGSNSICWIGPIPMFLTSDPQTIQDILKSKNCIDKPTIIYNGFASLLGSGLITQSEPKWSKHRKIFDKGFAKTTLKRDYKGTNYNLSGMVNNINSILKYAVEISFNQLLKVQIIRYLAELTVHRKAKESLEEFKKIIKDSTKIIVKNDITNPSYLPNIMTNLDCGFSGLQQSLVTLEELESNLLNIFVGGFETTSTGLYLVICMLAMHAEYQERAYNEVITVMADADDVTFTYDQINQLVYLEMIINETLRLFPFIPATFRIVSNESVKLSNGLVLPLGQTVLIDLYRLHRTKAVYGPKADRFNPENFSSENIKQRHPYAFIPFSKGQRFCIGSRYAYLSMKIFLAQLIRNYRFVTNFKFDNLKTVNRISIQLVEEPEIKIERRGICSQLN